jgi:pimeloyl-ACP methyl ester carboxylesterase/DNA-binding CsgD family transcriptional regulator
MSMESQEVRYCTSADGVRIAYAVEGSGPPLLYIGLFTYTVDFPRDPSILGLRLGLTEECTTVGFDRRGVGLSQRDIPELTLASSIADVEAVVSATGMDRFDMIGAYDGAHLALAYYVRHPEKVRRMVLIGLCRSAAAVMANVAGGLLEYVRTNWDSALLALAAIALRNAPGEPLPSLIDAYRRALSQEAALKYLEFTATLDSTDLLGQITVPTLVLHWRDDATVPLAEGREAAAMIPGSRFVTAEGQGPPWVGGPFLETIVGFLRETDETKRDLPAGMTGREAEILALLATGRSNSQIAERLSISARTAERHIQNIYLKTGTHNRAEATAYAVKHGITAGAAP